MTTVSNLAGSRYFLSPPNVKSVKNISSTTSANSAQNDKFYKNKKFKIAAAATTASALLLAASFEKITVFFIRHF